MEKFLKSKKHTNRPDVEKINFVSFDLSSFCMKLEELGNNLNIHKGQAPFHTMSKDQEFFSWDDKTKEVLLDIIREFDGVENDLIFYERWLVNCDRDNKKRRHIFR